MDPDDDAERMVTRASAGDRVAIEALLQRHLSGLRAYVRLQAGPAVRARESCSDLVQSVCREVLGDLDGFEYRGEAAFKAWLYQAALHKVIDRNRHWHQQRRDVAREVDLTDGPDAALAAAYRSVATPSRAAIAREDLERVEAAFDRMPDDYREVLVRSRVLGMSHREIAADIGRTEAATRQLLSRALARLTTLLDD